MNAEGSGLLPQIVAIGSAPIDVLVRRIDRGRCAKHAAEITISTGGCPINVAKAAASLGVGTAIIVSQASPLSSIIREEMAAMGGAAYFADRPESFPAVTVGMPTDASPGSLELYTQRRPFFRSDVLPCLDLVRNAPITVVGPAAAPDEDTRSWMLEVAETAPFAALIPHPDLVRSAAFFAEVAASVRYVQTNASELRTLFAGAGENLLSLAAKLSDLLGGQVEFAITNGAETGVLFARDGKAGQFHAITPPQIQAVSDVGAGDAFLAGYVIHRVLYGQTSAEACRAATTLASEWVAGVYQSRPAIVA